MSKSKINFIEHLKPQFPAGCDASELDAPQALTGLSLEQIRKECANQNKAHPHREKSAPEL